MTRNIGIPVKESKQKPKEGDTNNPFNIGTGWRENNSEIVFDISSTTPQEGI